MAVKQIQLRGISRTPSDRMNEDGGVAESLNTYIAEAESAPALPPEDKAEEYGLPVTNDDPLDRYKSTYRAVYIHKVGNENHFIYVARTIIPTPEGDQFKESLYAFPGKQLIFSDAWGVEILDKTVTSIGNTLVFSTNQGNGYAIFKNGEYYYLGGSIPQPKLAVYPNLYGYKAKLNHNIEIYPESTTDPMYNEDTKDYFSLYKAYSDSWQQELEKDESERSLGFSRIMGDFWKGMQNDLLGTQYFRYPVFVRFAMKLYDNSYIYHTVPVFLGGGTRRTFVSELVYRERTVRTESGSNPKYYSASVKIAQETNAYKIVSKLLNPGSFDDWKDIVQSIDMFITAPILYPEMNTDMVECDDSVENSTALGFTRTMAFRFQDPAGSKDEMNSIKESILDGSRLFYKVRSFSVSNLAELAEGFEQKNTKQLSYVENLATRETLTDDFRTNNTYTSERNYIVNRRILSLGMTETFGRGMKSLYGLVGTSKITTSNPESHQDYKFLYEINDNDGSVRYVYSDDYMRTPVLDCEGEDPPRREGGTGSGRSTEGSDNTAEEIKYNSDVCQILFYPDTRCVAVHVIDDDGKSVRLEMKSHPHLNCAYYIGDISKTLSDLEFSEEELPEESREGTSYKNSYLFQSALENPFYYPASGRIKFSANLIAVAAISTALSEGQFGQFDLYAFTDSGIWVLTPNDEGTYVRINPLSRDVCLSADSVVSIDQAVVFITAKGVMLLDGSQITSLSPSMNGKHYSMEQSAIDVLKSHEAGDDYGFALADNTPFMNYMGGDGTQIAYDYTGGRLIFFNPGYNYEYVYVLQTATWHKYVMDIQKNNSPAMDMKILNSYPDCYMFCRDADNVLHMYTWSTVLDVLDEDTEVTSIIASRPFDLGEPDILKTINHLKIRGMYKRYATDEDGNKIPRVSYILLGSQDGIHFYRLGSLRGKSWKMFRIIIMSKLFPTERISYIDVDYESRFTNKLR